MLICSAIGIAIRHCDKVPRYLTGALMQQLKVGVFALRQQRVLVGLQFADVFSARIYRAARGLLCGKG